MIKCIGRIEFGKELTFTQAQRLTLYLNLPVNKSYNKINLEISSDGRALQWNKIEDIQLLHLAMLDIVNDFFKPNKIRANGVLVIVGDNKMKYEIVVLKNMVKIYQDGEIRSIE